MASEGNTLGKVSRLSGKKSIATLLADGKWGSYGHFRYCWLAAAPGGSGVNGTDDQATASGSERPGRILISVPKRFFKRAVKRNLLKRRIREAYRV
ncbi:MAG: ribonuclease P protein component, partial [Bacteroidales bacterium]|nr:ribonuclease P protein component [Bacteroidales bacterium]